MKKLLILALAFAATTAYASSLGLPNELINPSFEQAGDYWSQNYGPGWTGSGFQVIFPGWFWGAGPRTGAKGIGVASNWGVNTGEVTQIKPVAQPGIYEVDLSGWAWLYDTGGNDSYIKAELTVDGVVVASRTVSPLTDPQQTWVYIELRWTGYVEAFKDVHLVGVGDGRIGGWGVAATDDWDLEEYLIPEPSSILALLTGLAGLGGLALRRR